MMQIVDRLAALKNELEDFSPISARLDIDLQRPIKALEADLPEGAVTLVGRATERVLKKLWRDYEVQGSPDDRSINELIKGVRHFISAPAVLEALTDIQRLRNRGSHDGHEVGYDDAVLSLRKLVVVLDWYRTLPARDGDIATRLDPDVEARVEFLSGLYQTMNYRLAKRFDLTSSTCYLLLQRSRGLRVDYVELIIGNSVDELLIVVEKAGEQLVQTELPTCSRYLVVNFSASNTPEVTYRVITYEGFLNEIVDVVTLAASHAGRAGRTARPVRGTHMQLGVGSNQTELQAASDALDWLKNELRTSSTNVLVCGGAAVGKTTLLAGLLDPEWTSGPAFRFFIDLGDRRPKESLEALVVRQLAPFFSVDTSRVFEVFL